MRAIAVVLASFFIASCASVELPPPDLERAQSLAASVFKGFNELCVEEPNCQRSKHHFLDDGTDEGIILARREHELPIVVIDLFSPPNDEPGFGKTVGIDQVGRFMGVAEFEVTPGSDDDLIYPTPTDLRFAVEVLEKAVAALDAIRQSREVASRQ